MNERQAAKAAASVAIAANAVRIQMIEIMGKSEIAVGELAQRLGLSQSATSQHLARFKRAGLLVQRQDKQTRYCSIKPDRIDLLQKLIAIAERQASDRAQRAKRP